MIKKGLDIITGGLIVVLVLCFFVPEVYAQGNITLGRLAVRPGIAAKVDYWDNIFYASETDETGTTQGQGVQDDILYTLSPSITMGYAGEPGNYINFGGFADLVYYTDYSDNNYQTLSPFIYLGFKSPMGFYLRVYEDYLWTKDPFGSSNTYAKGENTKRWNNKISLSGGYEFYKLAIEVMYENYMEAWDLAKDNWQDRIDHTVGISFFYKLTGKTALLGQYRRTMAEYTKQDDGIRYYDTDQEWDLNNSQDYFLNDFFIGARFEPGGKLNGEIKLGYGTKEFENEHDPAGRAYEDDGGLIAETQVGYQITERTNVDLNLQRAFVGSPDGDAASYIDTSVLFMINQKFAHRFSASLGASLSNQYYRYVVPNHPDKTFNIYGCIVKVNYDIQDWLKAGIAYKYEDKQASDTYYQSQEYKSNMIAGLISVVF